MRPRIGAYVLTGDPTWLASSLASYYAAVDDLVVLVPHDGRSWTGRPLPVQACLDAVRAVDVEAKARIVEGTWTNALQPLRAENAQRQAGLDELSGCDWVLQIDNDEILLNPQRLLDLLEAVDGSDIIAVEWPMRVLYRRLRALTYLSVVGRDGSPQYDYPGPIAIRPTTRLVDCRRPEPGGGFIRPVVAGDRNSPSIAGSPRQGERRVDLAPRDAIIHNSWGRSPGSIWRKLGSSAHQFGFLRPLYFALVWMPAPLTWRWLRNFHPMARRLWPRLAPEQVPVELLLPRDR